MVMLSHLLLAYVISVALFIQIINSSGFPDECRYTGMGREYRGKLSRTKSGKTCQRWDRQTPHHHSNREGKFYPDSSVAAAKNYCRNPDGSYQPWCYTTDRNKRFDYCNVKMCKYAECKHTKRGREYKGKLYFTKNGHICQKWTKQTPKKHNKKPGGFPDASMSEANNYCRNPDNEPDGPWCYTTSGPRWESCNVKLCPKKNPKGCSGIYVHRYGRTCYALMESTMKYGKSKTKCENTKGHLLTITSQGMQNHVYHVVKFYSNHAVWRIDGKRKKDKSGRSTNTFIDWHGRDLKYKHWAPGEPSANHEECITLNKGEHYGVRYYGKWNDETCNNKRPFICGTEIRIDGAWSTWSAPGRCSVSCGKGGHVSQSRKCNNPKPNVHGKKCPGEKSRQKECPKHVPCPVHGKWGTWLRVGKCSVTCGKGTIGRKRKCDKPSPKYGGKACSGEATRTDTCEMRKCPINGAWGNWKDAGQCSATCGPGKINRLRKCNNPEPQHGGKPCDGSPQKEFACPKPKTCPKAGNWGDWISVGSCTRTCGGGKITKTRKCDNPRPSHGGPKCPGEKKKQDPCNTKLCPRNGKWSVWIAAGKCSVTCGEGVQRKQRQCDNPKPRAGGKLCQGAHQKDFPCKKTVCPRPGKWGTWKVSATCSTTCGKGYRQKVRKCIRPDAGSKPCVGQSTGTKECIKGRCPINGKWGSWNVWSTCSLTCGKGRRKRRRECDSPKPSRNGKPCSVGGSKQTKDCEAMKCFHLTHHPAPPPADCKIPFADAFSVYHGCAQAKEKHEFGCPNVANINEGSTKWYKCSDYRTLVSYVAAEPWSIELKCEKRNHQLFILSARAIHYTGEKVTEKPGDTTLTLIKRSKPALLSLDKPADQDDLQYLHTPFEQDSFNIPEKSPIKERKSSGNLGELIMKAIRDQCTRKPSCKVTSRNTPALAHRIGKIAHRPIGVHVVHQCVKIVPRRIDGCVFPFKFANMWWFTCIASQKTVRPWCGSSFGDVNRHPQSRRACSETVHKARGSRVLNWSCAKRFTYRLKTYTGCTTASSYFAGVDEKLKWCSVTENYDEEKKWLACDGSM